MHGETVKFYEPVQATGPVCPNV